MWYIERYTVQWRNEDLKFSAYVVSFVCVSLLIVQPLQLLIFTVSVSSLTKVF